MGYANPLSPGADSPFPIPPRTGRMSGAPTWNPNSSSTTGNYPLRQLNANAGTTDRHGAGLAEHEDRRSRPREPENEHAATTYLDHAPRHGAVPADDRWARPREPENEHGATTYHAPHHGAVLADDRRARPREPEDEHGATTYHAPHYGAVLADDRRSRPREPENEHAATTYLDHAPRHGAVPADDRRGRPPEPENERAVTTYHAPRHGAAPSPAEDRRVGPREHEDEHGATLSMGNHRALAHVSASPHGVAQLYEPPPFIPPLTTEDEGGQQRERHRSRKWPESSSDEDYDSATSDMDIDTLSDLDSTPEMLGKGKGVAVASAPRPMNTPTYSQMAAHPSNSAQSSASTTAYRQQGPSYDSQWERWAPQSTFGNSKQDYPALHRKPSKCIVCKIKPPYDRNGKSYPTCGLTCAAQLEEQKQRDARNSGRSSSYPGPCEVCHVRPKYRNELGRTFPTCGNRCAAIRDPGRTCTVCKRRPKLSTGTGKYYDQCSACRDKAKAAPTTAAIVTCTSCLACWVNPAQGPDQPYCSDDCKRAMLNCAPALIEMPRGHILFDKYHKQFQTGWDTTSQRKVVARHMYFFAQAPVVVGRYEAYKPKLEASLRGRRSGETEGWVAITRECNVGDSGSVEMCNSADCDFCNIMLNSFTRHAYPQGVPVAFTAVKASEGLRDARRGSTKALLFVKVIHGPPAQLPECTGSQLVGSQRGRDDVVAVKPYSSSRTRTELRVYNPDAILPLGLLVYSEK